MGHIANCAVLRKGRKKSSKLEEASLPKSMPYLIPCHSVAILICTKLNWKELSMEVDTDTSLSLMSETTYKKLWESDALPELQQTSVKLCTYTGEEIHQHEGTEQRAKSSPAAIGARDPAYWAITSS